MSTADLWIAEAHAAGEADPELTNHLASVLRSARPGRVVVRDETDLRRIAEDDPATADVLAEVAKARGEGGVRQ